MKKSRIALLNAHYSANLGDGLLSDCLMFGLGPELDSYPVDLAGREEISTLGGNRRGQILKALNAMPSPVRSFAIRQIQNRFVKTKWRPHFEAKLKESDAVILGGGNLIADQDLNFPVKIHTALSVAKAYEKPCYLYGVGVGGSFSQKGAELFNEAFSSADIREVYVRDARSKRNWDEFFAQSSGCKATVVWDPGLLASLTWPIAEADQKGPIRVGIISPDELSYHEGSEESWDVTDWYQRFIQDLINTGKEVRLFSNGSPEDTRYLQENIAPLFPELSHDIPKNQEELSRLLGQSDLVAAFRLHALIPTISYNRPILALAWDAKVRSFAEKIGQSHACIDVKETSPEDAAIIAVKQMNAKQDFSQQVGEAKAEVETLAAKLSGGMS